MYVVVVYTNNYGNLSKVLYAAVRCLYIYYTQIQAFLNNGENDPSKSAQQKPNESNQSPEKDPDTQSVNLKGAPSCKKCGQIFQWNQLQLQWMHECTLSAESDKHVANTTPMVVTSEVPLVAKPEARTDTTPDVSTLATCKEPTDTTPEASTLATPEAHVTDSFMEQDQLDIRVCMYVYLCSRYLHVIYTIVSIDIRSDMCYNLHISHLHAAS